MAVIIAFHAFLPRLPDKQAAGRLSSRSSRPAVVENEWQTDASHFIKKSYECWPLPIFGLAQKIQFSMSQKLPIKKPEEPFLASSVRKLPGDL